MQERPILQRKWYLYVTEFFSGMSVMAVELGASRLLAPYFSSSQIVWTIIIGTIMIAMALGNLWGGRSADRDPSPDKLYRRLLIAAVWIAAIPVVGKYVIAGITCALILAISTNLLVIAAFLSCIVLFVYPLFLLGTVTPSLVKYTMDSMEDSGRTVGRLGAANTVGSIIGTFVPTFVTIPAAGTSVTFLLFAGVLLLISLVYFFSGKTGRRTAAVSISAFLVCCLFGHSSNFAFWEDDLTYEGESVYNYLQVAEWSDRTILSTNVLFGVQSVKMKEDGLTGMYYDYALAAPVMAGTAEKKDAEVLILGNGTGTFATQCGTYFPEASVEGVEIDAKITQLAKTYFDLPEEEKVTTYDGRAYLQTIDKTYDVIMVDAYRDITIPFSMSTVEFFTQVRDHLNPGGVLVVNLSLVTDSENRLNNALCDTISSVFGSVYTVDVAASENREVFACKDGDAAEQLRENLADVSYEDLKTMLTGASYHLDRYRPGASILTDDKAPVELLGMDLLDSYIQQEIGYYQGIYREQGFEGLISAIG
jgi:spermidine synthase